MAVPNRRQKAKTLVKRDFYAEQNKEATKVHKREGERVSEKEHEERVNLLKKLGLIKETKKDD